MALRIHDKFHFRFCTYLGNCHGGGYEHVTFWDIPLFSLSKFNSSTVVRHLYMIMRPAGLALKNDSAGEAQQQFTWAESQPMFRGKLSPPFPKSNSNRVSSVKSWRRGDMLLRSASYFDRRWNSSFYISWGGGSLCLDFSVACLERLYIYGAM
jgi:hypothetical protein